MEVLNAIGYVVAVLAILWFAQRTIAVALRQTARTIELLEQIERNTRSL